MTQEEFHKLVHHVIDRQTPPPPETLFAGGMDNWHARARLAHFLAMPKSEHRDEAIELLRSVVEAEVDEENSQDVEEKVYALQKLSTLEREDKNYDDALRHINLAIELAESTDFLYKYILRGELWADRWSTLHAQGSIQSAEEEVDERIAAYEDIPIKHNSYLYYGYRFKAQLAAERGVPLVAKDYMHMALKYMDIPESYLAGLNQAFNQQHENASWILNTIDHATPNPDSLHWDI